MKFAWLLSLLFFALSALIFVCTRPPPSLPGLPPEKLSRRHPAPPSDLLALNQATGENISHAVFSRLDGQVAAWTCLPQGKPVVLVFFSHDCDCSLEFAQYFHAAMAPSKTKASWYFIFADTPAQISAFTQKAKLSLPVLRDPRSVVASHLHITKSGCFVLLQPSGLVSAVWSGTSLAGLNDLFSRLQLPPLSSDLPALSGLPQAPTAGCPLPP